MQWKKTVHFDGNVNTVAIPREALASQDLWIWHYFFGMANSHNSYGEL
jgi:hypothetical protein